MDSQIVKISMKSKPLTKANTNNWAVENKLCTEQTDAALGTHVRPGQKHR